MRVTAPRFILLLVFALFVGGASTRAFADARADAKVHYQAGVKAYGSQDYRTAIKEFSAAQQLMPADLNNYNLGLCYDKLGEAEPAVQYYKEYLAKVPNADKRTEIEASISRLEAALQSAAAKKADEQKKADEAAKAEEARKAEEAAKAEEARKAEEAKAHPPVGGGTGGTGGIGTGVSDVPTGVGSTGTPSTGQAVSTGDSQLDRVAAIDINQIRDQRVGGGSSGIPDNRGGPATVGANGNLGAGGAMGGAGAQGAGMGAQGPQGAQGQGQMGQQGQGQGQGVVGADDKPVKKETPVYKKWWFWAVVAVSAYVVYSIAVDGSSNRGQARDVLPPQSPNADGGATIMRF